MLAVFPRNLSRNNVTFCIKVKLGRKACNDPGEQEIFKFKEENFAFPSCNPKTVGKCTWDWECSEATNYPGCCHGLFLCDYQFRSSFG